MEKKVDIDFMSIVSTLPLVVWTAAPDGGLTYISQQWQDIYGNPLDESLGNGWAKFVHPEDVENAAVLWANSLKTGQNYETEFRVQHKNTGYKWILVRAIPKYNAEGEIISWNGSNTDVNDKKVSEEAARKSEERFRAMADNIPNLAWMANADGWIYWYNKKWYDYTGTTPEQMEGWGWQSVHHPAELPHVLEGWRASIKNGEAFEMVFPIKGANGKFKQFLTRVLPVKDESGQIHQWFGSNTDITQQLLAEKAIKESEQNLRNVILQSPVAMCILKGKKYIVELANDLMFELWGKSASELMSRPIFDGLPEAKDQGFEALLDGVYNSGEKFSAYGVPISLPRNGKIENVYINLVYEAYREPDGSISGVLAVATDVTEQVNARKKIEEAETFLRGAIELANLGTWTIDLKTKILDYDARLRNWFGFSSDELIDVEKAYVPIIEEERYLVKESMIHALTPGTDGIYNVEYKIKNLKDGSIKIIHAQGKAVLDDKNEIYKITGTARDVTNERNIEIELTRQVKERTEELAASNEKLQATNEEIAATNEELEESNVKLHSSNAELEQFAYIASHDLQEPVRKISTFTQMLEKSLGNIGEKSKNYIEKINSSTERMTVLIRDVLAYSQLSGINEIYDRVNLNQILEEVITDFELSIEQKHAIINYSGLPIIEAIPLQMSQLFSNMLSNSLKYSKDGILPEINITADLLSEEEVITYPTLNHNKSYYKIQFSDNGIGIKAEQIDRIFNIFQRLHAKTEYSGTGIGLSICKKIVVNHHGYISANSNDDGTVFNIILPRHFRKRVE